MCATDRSCPGTAGRGRWGVLLSVALALAIGPALVLAQSAPSREQEQIRRLRQQVQQLQQELSVARQAEASARADLGRRATEAEAQARRAQRGAAGTRARVAELEAELGTLLAENTSRRDELTRRTAERDDARKALAQATDELARRGRQLAEGQRGLNDLQSRFVAQNAALDLCARHNRSLQAVSLELLDRWQRHDWLDTVAAREPLIQSRRVAIENLVQGYEDRIDAALLPARP